MDNNNHTDTDHATIRAVFEVSGDDNEKCVLVNDLSYVDVDTLNKAFQKTIQESGSVPIKTVNDDVVGRCVKSDMVDNTLHLACDLDIVFKLHTDGLTINQDGEPA